MNKKKCIFCSHYSLCIYNKKLVWKFREFLDNCPSIIIDSQILFDKCFEFIQSLANECKKYEDIRKGNTNERK
jgi:hypothetical protein